MRDIIIFEVFNNKEKSSKFTRKSKIEAIRLIVEEFRPISEVALELVGIILRQKLFPHINIFVDSRKNSQCLKKAEKLSLNILRVLQ